MTEVKGVRRRTQLIDDLRNIRGYLELKEEAEGRKKMETTVLSIEHEEEIQVIFDKSMGLLLSSLLNILKHYQPHITCSLTGTIHLEQIMQSPYK